MSPHCAPLVMVLKKCKAHFYISIYRKHYGSVSKGISPEIIGVLQKIYDLRIANRCAEADCLENLFQNFLGKCYGKHFCFLLLSFYN